MSQENIFYYINVAYNLQLVHMGFLEKTVLRNAIQHVQTVIYLMVCVILDVTQAGRETIVTKVII